MSEKHPIDELFHRALHDAEVTPPPAVWEGIARARSRRKGRFGVWLLAGLLLAGGYAVMLVDRKAVPEAEHAQLPDRRGSHAPTPADPDADRTTLANSNPTTPTPASGPVDGPMPTPSGPSRGPAIDGRASNLPPSANAAKPHRGTELDPARERSGSTAGTMPSAPTGTLGTTLTPSFLLPLDILPTRPTPGMDSLHRIAPDPVYVLPRGEWWIGLELGRHDVDRTWYGKEEALVSALNATEVPHITWSAGLLLGRSWRSGFGLSVGAAYEGSSYAFNHLDQLLVVDSFEVMPYLVTLDTQIFVSNVDTTVYGTTVAREVNGTNRLSVVHVPVEGYWHTGFRRWTLGARLGLAAEFTTGRQGYTLDTDGEGGSRSVNNASSAYDRRYSPVLSGMVGLDAGYALNEHWGLWLTPTYMRGLEAFGTNNGPYTLPERFSLRLRLTYSFTHIP